MDDFLSFNTKTDLLAHQKGQGGRNITTKFYHGVQCLSFLNRQRSDRFNILKLSKERIFIKLMEFIWLNWKIFDDYLLGIYYS